MNAYRLQSIITFFSELLEYFKAESHQIWSVWLGFLLQQFIAGVSDITFLAPDVHFSNQIHYLSIIDKAITRFRHAHKRSCA